MHATIKFTANIGETSFSEEYTFSNMLSLRDSINGVPLRPSAERRWIRRDVLTPTVSEEAKPTFPFNRFWWMETGRQSLVEFVGDTMFIFIGSLAAGTGTITAGSASALTAAFAHGLTIALLIVYFGPISGGHFNPAVTLGVVVTRNMHPIRGLMFAVAQLLGGFVGALLVRLVTSTQLYASAYNGITTLTHPGEISVGEAIACELILTYLLVQTVLCSAVDSDGKNVLAPLAIGFSITADILAGGEISGASMNPARSFGPSVVASMFNSINSGGIVTTRDPWTYQYVYWVGPLTGGALAGLIYKMILARDDKRWLLRPVSKLP